MGDCEMLEVDRLLLLANVCPCDALLEQQGVEEDQHEGEEVAIEVISSWLDLGVVKFDLLLGGSEIPVWLDTVHVAWLQLEEEVLDLTANPGRSELEFLPSSFVGIVDLPDLALILLVLLLALGLLSELALPTSSTSTRFFLTCSRTLLMSFLPRNISLDSLFSTFSPSDFLRKKFACCRGDGSFG